METFRPRTHTSARCAGRHESLLGFVIAAGSLSHATRYRAAATRSTSVASKDPAYAAFKTGQLDQRPAQSVPEEQPENDQDGDWYAQEPKQCISHGISLPFILGASIGTAKPARCLGRGRSAQNASHVVAAVWGLKRGTVRQRVKPAYRLNVPMNGVPAGDAFNGCLAVCGCRVLADGRVVEEGPAIQCQQRSSGRQNRSRLFPLPIGIGRQQLIR
jgi:hypothetical protein